MICPSPFLLLPRVRMRSKLLSNWVSRQYNNVCI